MTNHSRMKLFSRQPGKLFLGRQPREIVFHVAGKVSCLWIRMSVCSNKFRFLMFGLHTATCKCPGDSICERMKKLWTVCKWIYFENWLERHKSEKIHVFVVHQKWADEKIVKGIVLNASDLFCHSKDLKIHLSWNPRIWNLNKTTFLLPAKPRNQCEQAAHLTWCLLSRSLKCSCDNWRKHSSRWFLAGKCIENNRNSIPKHFSNLHNIFAFTN